VVNSALNLSKTTQESSEEPITLDFPLLANEQKISAKILPGFWSPLSPQGKIEGANHRDLAILKVEGTLPKGAQPLPVSTALEFWKHPFGAYGYPREKPTGTWASGDLLHPDDNGLIQIEDRKQTGYFVQLGFSGTPVWDTTIGRVVGIVSQAYPKAGKRVAFVTPISTVKEFCPQAFLSANSALERLSIIPPGVPPGYRTNTREFFRIYLGSEQSPKPFGGRDRQLSSLDNWLEGENSDRLLLVAPAGRGKSMLLVRWAAEVSESYSVIFIPISIRKRTNRPETIFQALAAHIALAVGQNLPSTPINPAPFYHDKVREYLEEYGYNQDKPLLIILDGLDEAAGFADYEESLFPEDQISNIKLIISARLTANAPDAETWLRRLGWNVSIIRPDHMLIPSLDQEGLKDVLYKMGCPLSDLADDADIVLQLLRLTDGDPLIVGLYVEDLWCRRDTVTCLTPEDLKHISSGFDGYFHKWFDDQKRLWGDKSPLQEKETLGVLAILACALGPLQAGEIARLFKIIHDTDIDGVPHIIVPLERFVIGNPDSDGYALSHPKLSHFLTSPDNRIVDRNMILKTRQGFLFWGRMTLIELKDGGIRAEAVSKYLLFYYAHHLALENASVADFMALVEDGWRQAWYTYEGGEYGFANDINTVLKRVKKATNSRQKQPSDHKINFFVEWFRCVFCLSSIQTIGANISGELLRVAVECHILSDQQAINHIFLKIDQDERASSLIKMASVVQGSKLPKLFEAARSISDTKYRADALIGLTPHLPVDLKTQAVTEALKAARDISDESSQANALIDLAPHLSDDLKLQALEEVCSISNESSRTDALIGLAPYLPDELKPQALEATRSISDGKYRADALIGLAPYLPDELKPQALEVTRSISSESYRMYALIGLLPNFSEELKLQVVTEAFKAVRSISDVKYRAEAFIGLAPHLPVGLKMQAVTESLKAARDIGDESSRVNALIGLAPHLPDKLKTQAMTEALEAVCSISSEFPPSVETLIDLTSYFGGPVFRVNALIGLAPHLPDNLMPQALKAARSISDGKYRAKALIGLAPHLPDNLMLQALEAARSISDGKYRADALIGLAPYLPVELKPQVVNEALEAVCSIGKEGFRTKTLIDLAVHLPDNFKQQAVAKALEDARSIGGKKAQVDALIGLVPHLSENFKRQAVAKAFQAACNIGSEWDRTKVLKSLAPHLSDNLKLQALEDVCSISIGSSRTDALIGLAPYLPDNLMSQAFKNAFSIGGKKAQVAALIGLVPHLSENLKQQAVAKAFQAARSIGSEWDRTKVLKSLAPHLSDNLKLQALEDVCSISIGSSRTDALIGLAPYLPDNLMPQALEAARNISDKDYRADALIGLTPHLPDNLVPQALEAVCSISFERPRAKALIGLAPHLPDNLVLQALEAARSISDVKYRADALIGLTPHLPDNLKPQVMAEALTLVNSIDSEISRAKALIGLAPHLPDNLMLQALEAARSIGGRYYQADALIGLAPYLPDNLMPQALEATRRISDEMYRVNVLIGLTPHLPDKLKPQVMKHWLEIASRLKRNQLLQIMTPQFTNTIVKFITQKDIERVYRTIREICLWWP
jgi:hypothetical protein